MAKRLALLRFQRHVVSGFTDHFLPLPFAICGKEATLNASITPLSFDIAQLDLFRALDKKLAP